jgi:hypothetical protein
MSTGWEVKIPPFAAKTKLTHNRDMNNVVRTIIPLLPLGALIKSPLSF